MPRFFQPLLFMLAKCQEDQLVRQIEFLQTENKMLRKRVPKKRIFLDPSERSRLLELGKELGPSIRYLITIVSYSTFRRWVRREDGVLEPTRKGRPRLDAQLRELVVRIAKETGWGYSKILGELKKLRVGKISRQSVKNILIENGFDPGPKRGKGTWSEFLHVHKETLWQIDFFSKRVWTLKGPRQVFALAFLHIGTRRVFVMPSTFKPHEKWMVAQAQAFLDHAKTEKLPCEMIMRDFDGKYSKPFDQVFKDQQIKIKKVGPRAPNLNAFIERFVQSVKSEALNFFMVFGLEHFDLIVSEFVDYYLEQRPHQGLGNKLLPKPGESPDDSEDELATLPFDLSQIKCETRLGGLLRS